MVRDYRLTLPLHILQPHRILYGFSVMIQKQFFAYFSSLPRRSNISIRKTLQKIRKSYSFCENDLKHEKNFGKVFASEGVGTAYIARTIFFIYGYLNCCV